MKTKKQLYTPPIAERIGVPHSLPSLLATVSNISVDLDGDWLDFGDLEEQPDWRS